MFVTTDLIYERVANFGVLETKLEILRNSTHSNNLYNGFLPGTFYQTYTFGRLMYSLMVYNLYMYGLLQMARQVVKGEVIMLYEYFQ